MNTINVKVNFTRGTCEVSGINLITGDYNSTKMVFTFDREDGTKIFEMKSPSEQLVMVQEIQNNEIILYGEDENENVASIFSEDGYYIFEISLYENDSKLTSASGKIKVKPEQVVIDGEVVEAYLPVFDQLLSEVSTALAETSNLDIEVSKSGSVATITLTDKEGTTHTTNINDGTSLEDMEIDDGDLKVTYGGDTENLGQVVPNIQVGTTTTLSPGASASVTNVGTELNPILNFAIPKGDAGAIKILIVAELPQTGQDDTIYLVPIPIIEVASLPATGEPKTIYIVIGTGKRYIYESEQWLEVTNDNNYFEYVYINNKWEELGEIGVQVDLTDYVKNTDYATPSKAGVIKSGYNGLQVDSTNGKTYCDTYTFANYGNVENQRFISKGTLENVLTNRIGNIQTLLDNLDTGSGV